MRVRLLPIRISAAHILTYVFLAIAGACITASYALLRGRGTRVARMYAIDASVNCAIAGATFFSACICNTTKAPLTMLPGVKNYWVEPVLAKAKASEISQQPVTDGSELPSWWGLRTKGLPDVAFSGAVTGGLFGWRRCMFSTSLYPQMLTHPYRLPSSWNIARSIGRRRLLLARATVSQ